MMALQHAQEREHDTKAAASQEQEDNYPEHEKPIPSPPALYDILDPDGDTGRSLDKQMAEAAEDDAPAAGNIINVDEETNNNQVRRRRNTRKDVPLTPSKKESKAKKTKQVVKQIILTTYSPTHVYISVDVFSSASHPHPSELNLRRKPG